MSHRNHMLSTVSKVVTPKISATIHVAAGKGVGDLARVAAVKKPGVYIGVWPGDTRPIWYVGQSGRAVSTRLYDGKFHCPGPADLVLAITAPTDEMTPADSRVLERLLHITAVEAGYRVHGDIPPGAVVSEERYAALRLLFSEVCISLQTARLAFEGVPTRSLMAGPATAPGRALESSPSGDRYTLKTAVGPAAMIEAERGYWITPGSPVRIAPGAESRSIGVLQMELRHAGVLVPVEGDWYAAAQSIGLDSPSAAARFVTGHSGGSPDQWRGADGVSAPTRVADRDRVRDRRAAESRRTAPNLASPGDTIEPVEGFHG